MNKYLDLALEWHLDVNRTVCVALCCAWLGSSLLPSTINEGESAFSDLPN